jgi:hypothetical protein
MRYPNGEQQSQSGLAAASFWSRGLRREQGCWEVPPVFHWKVSVSGFLQPSGGGFSIDTPDAAPNRVLNHSFVESPNMMNVNSGDVATDADGNATVEMPGYFEALNRDLRYQFTVIGQFAQVIVAEEVREPLQYQDRQAQCAGVLAGHGYPAGCLGECSSHTG